MHLCAIPIGFSNFYATAAQAGTPLVTKKIVVFLPLLHPISPTRVRGAPPHANKWLTRFNIRYISVIRMEKQNIISQA